MSGTIALAKVNLSLGAPLYQVDGDFGDGEYIRYTFTKPRTQRLAGLNTSALVVRGGDGVLVAEDVDIEVTLLESSRHHKYLFAAMASSVGLPLFFEDGENKIVGTCQLERAPDGAKSAAGFARTWRILGVNCLVTVGAAATA